MVEMIGARNGVADPYVRITDHCRMVRAASAPLRRTRKPNDGGTKMPNSNRHFVSSALAKPARPSPRDCARPASSGSPPGTFCSRKPKARSSSRAADDDRRALRHFRRRRRARRRHRRLRGYRRLERRGGAIGQGASRRQAVLPRHQFGVARPQAGNGEAPRRRRALCRRRRDRADSSGAASDADAACRPACRGDRAGARRARHARQRRRRRKSAPPRRSRWCAAS